MLRTLLAATIDAAMRVFHVAKKPSTPPVTGLWTEELGIKVTSQANAPKGHDLSP